MLGWAAIPRLEVGPGQRVRLPRAIFSDFLSGGAAFGVSPAIAQAYAALRDRVPLRQAQNGRIYVARIDAWARPMRSKSELITRLQRRGFRIVVPSTLSFAEQADTFRHARLIVGPHGAGLTNILFSPPGTFVYELLPRDYDNSCFRALADNCGLLHWADAFPNHGEEPPLVRAWDVDLGAVEARIDEIETLLAA